MPRRDGSGPNGMGTRTGRGLGVCTGVNSPQFGRGNGAGNGGRGQGGGGMGFRGGRNSQNSFGFGGGRGFQGGFNGAGWGQNTQYAATPYQETPQDLQEQAAFLKAELKAVQQRIADLEATANK